MASTTLVIYLNVPRVGEPGRHFVSDELAGYTMAVVGEENGSRLLPDRTQTHATILKGKRGWNFHGAWRFTNHFNHRNRPVHPGCGSRAAHHFTRWRFFTRHDRPAWSVCVLSHTEL